MSHTTSITDDVRLGLQFLTHKYWQFYEVDTEVGIVILTVETLDMKEAIVALKV